MLRGFVRADEDHGNVSVVALLQRCILVDVDFAERVSECTAVRVPAEAGNPVSMARVERRVRVKSARFSRAEPREYSSRDFAPSKSYLVSFGESSAMIRRTRSA